ncbi:hypothetical protein HOY80DRAFT_985691 [Tuber brumale]|nr:hypothetical protein HOY80DRAFT_985691 [Tuber brumale]
MNASPRGVALLSHPIYLFCLLPLLLLATGISRYGHGIIGEGQNYGIANPVHTHISILLDRKESTRLSCLAGALDKRVIIYAFADRPRY